MNEPDYNLPHPKLSELIRQGAQLHPQYFGGWWDKTNEDGIYNPGNPIKATCALGAASCAIGREGDAISAEGKLLDLLGYSYANYPKVPLPVITTWDIENPTVSVRIFCAVEVLNDDARWTRERIADWLESIGY